MSAALPPAWAELIEAIGILAKHPTSEVSPFNCTHDQLYVCADAEAFTRQERERLAELGFLRDDDGGFYSFKYGSA